jgi:hypothetical protein
MSIIAFILKMPCWYVLILIVFSLFYAIREIMERIIRLSNDGKKNNKKDIITTQERVIIYYVRDFLSQVIFTSSSFIALFIANDIFSSLKSFNDISSGTAILLIFLIIWGIAGASGYLGYIIVAGKFRGK